MNKMVAVDIETTGLDPCRHEIIEVGIYGRFTEVWHGDGSIPQGAPIAITFSLSFDEAKASPEALEINGWGKRPFPPEVPEAYAASLMNDVLTDALIVASPSFFDIGFLDAFYRTKVEGNPPWSHRNILDLKSYVYGKFPVPFGRSNDHISEFLQVKNTKDHTALGDARWTWEMFKKAYELKPEDRSTHYDHR